MTHSVSRSLETLLNLNRVTSNSVHNGYKWMNMSGILVHISDCLQTAADLIGLEKGKQIRHLLAEL